MTCSFIAIRGNYTSRAAEIFGAFKYNDTGQDKEFTDWDTFNDFLADNYIEFADKAIAIRGIWANNGWTIINDPELVDATDENALLALTQQLKTDVLSFIIQTTSNT